MATGSVFALLHKCRWLNSLNRGWSRFCSGSCSCRCSLLTVALVVLCVSNPRGQFTLILDILSLVCFRLLRSRLSWESEKQLVLSVLGRYRGGRRPSSDDSFHSPTVIPPSVLDKPSIMKRYHRRRTTRWGVTARSPTMVTLHETRFVECRWWSDGWTVKTVVTWRSLASMIPAPGPLVVVSWV